MSRHPLNIYHRRKFAETTRLGATQRELLERMAGLVKRGGCIVYSTCSLEPEENEVLASAWLKTHPKFHLRRSYQSFPPDSATDGAYAARYDLTI